ncbi:MAG TPA: glycosyl hydrolase family 28-related protein [Candidatus Eremiobacteraceae bacterium]|nr:glycosyl hydrolase family 28-related protein [Candidatus Eremiobacteraceae bacterium]
MNLVLRCAIFLILCSPSLAATSYYTSRIDDPRAVYLTPDNFPVRGDGIADDSDVVQQAINQVQERHFQGILFVPSGRYRISRTIYIWPGVRIIGYGTTRPVFVLGAHSPAFQQGLAYMFFFAGGRPAPNGSGQSGEAAAKPPDADPGTFYSAMSNIDLEIEDGNPAAVGVRAHYAQHCFLAHMDFHLASGLAGIHDGGNVAYDLRFYGGKYGIWTRKPSPGWQFTVIDASFEGQTEAAIREHEAGLTLIRPQFKNVPTAISIDDRYADELWMKDARLENITGPAVIISDEYSPRTEINMENVFCHAVPLFALFRESRKQITVLPETYRVQVFSHGLRYQDLGATPAIQDVFDTRPLAEVPAPVKSDVPDLPPVNQWVNVRTLGVTGDGSTDDTAAIKKAVAGRAVLYFPSGHYLVSDTIELRPDTILIGLHPSTTRILLADETPAFQGVGSPKPLLEAPKGGATIVTGIGLYTNGINPRAVALKWMAGANSMVNDVRFLGGHGSVDPDAAPDERRKFWEQLYNNNNTADSNIDRRWDSQYPSLWITAGGGGTFVNIWTPSTFAQAGLYISNTSTSGRVYQLSSEHHVRNEVVLHNAANWQIYALQNEEERGESGFALPLEIRDSSDITIANLHMYRVVSSYQPFPHAVTISNSKQIRFRNLHCYSDSKVSFDNSIYDQTHRFAIRQREFAWLTVSGAAPPEIRQKPLPTLADGAQVTKLVGGFFNISGGAVDSSGNVSFVDSHRQTIYCWSDSSHQLSIVRDNPLGPVQLAFDKSGDLLVVSYQGDGTVYTFNPHSDFGEITLLKPEASAPRPGMTPVLPVDYWRNENDFPEAIRKSKPYQFVSPDRSTFIPAGQDFVTGQLYYGAKIHDLLRAFGLALASSGQNFYVTDESEEKTYRATVREDGSFSNLRLFANVGGESVATDEPGNVYIAAGQIYVYNPTGQALGAIDVPERPLQLLFGGSDRRTLFIAARTSLYSVRTRYPGH